MASVRVGVKDGFIFQVRGSGYGVQESGYGVQVREYGGGVKIFSLI